ncbi:MAG: ester cyclase [Halobacteriota archaeon]
MSVDNNKAAVRHFWEGHLSTGNTLCEGDFAPTAVNHDPNSPPVPPGPEGITQLITLYRTAFPDLTATVEDMVAEGDEVAYRLTFHGTHRGEMMGIPPTGKQVTYTGIGIDKVVDGTIAEMWLNFDALGMLQQVGAAPSLDATTEKTR